MDKLQWFKFTPSDWMMGKIQRCPEVTQARFLRLCCLYWNKKCEISIDDAIIEIDKEHFDILKSKKIISVNDTHFNISFLDEQFLQINEDTKSKSNNGIIGNLKRWHPEIYSKFESKEISLNEAVKQSQSVATQSLPDSNQITTQSQSVAEKKREEKKREDNINKNDVFYFQLLESQTWLEDLTSKNINKFNLEQVKEKLLIFKDDLTLRFEFKNNKQEFASHFVRWLNQQKNEKRKPFFDSPA